MFCFNVPLINSLSAKKKKKKKEKKKEETMANFCSELAPNVIFNKHPTTVLRLHERPQATDNSMQLLNLTKPMEMVTRPLSSTSDGFGW